MSNVQPITDEWPEEAIAWFEETVTDSESLTCLPLQYTDNLWEVELFDASEGSIANLLKQKGYGIEITEVEEEVVRTFVTDVPAASLDHKMKIEVAISHLESPDNFWVQVCIQHILISVRISIGMQYTNRNFASQIRVKSF